MFGDFARTSRDIAEEFNLSYSQRAPITQWKIAANTTYCIQDYTQVYTLYIRCLMRLLSGDISAITNEKYLIIAYAESFYVTKLHCLH